MEDTVFKPVELDKKFNIDNCRVYTLVTLRNMFQFMMTMRNKRTATNKNTAIINIKFFVQFNGFKNCIFH